MSDKDQSKSTNSPHLVADGSSLFLAFWIGASIVAIWVAVLLQGPKVAIH